jgi:hypothetical protein
MALRAGVGGGGVLVWFGVVQVVGLGMPAGRQVGGQRAVDESGHGRGVGPAGVPLQGEGHELAGGHRADDCLGMGGRQGRDQQNPVDVALAGPADSGQVGVGEFDGRRGDARGVQGLALGQGPGGEQGFGGGAQYLVGEVGQRDRVAAGQAVAGAQADHERFGAEHLGSDPGLFADRAAGAFGATPGQVSAGLTVAQLIPALLGGILSVPAGISLYRIAARVAGGAPNANLPVSWMAAVIVGTVVVVAALTLFPARAAARRPVAAVLRSD